MLGTRRRTILEPESGILIRAAYWRLVMQYLLRRASISPENVCHVFSDLFIVCSRGLFDHSRARDIRKRVPSLPPTPTASLNFHKQHKSIAIFWSGQILSSLSMRSLVRRFLCLRMYASGVTLSISSCILKQLYSLYSLSGSKPKMLLSNVFQYCGHCRNHT